ncbi:hypothetical protein SLE2022_202110 [Rubroshorea leprosula]
MKKERKLFILLSISIYLNYTVLGTSSESPMPVPGKHFVLVHGSCHGAWSWYKVVPLLKSAGHNVTAIDLAASGVDPQQAITLRSVSDYFRPLTELMAALPPHEKVILVGHSLGGLAISQAMERFPEKISAAVFVTALMPGPALSVSALVNESFRRQGPLLDSRYAYGDGPNNPPTTFIFGPLYLSSQVYQLSPIQDSTLASMLMRPLRLFNVEDMSREIVATRERFGSVNRVFIISEEDLVATKDMQQWMIERNPPDEVREIKGSDHMVMMSKPIELFNNLLCIAAKYS